MARSLSDAQRKYYESLCSTAERAQDAYDKTVVALSGGAFGLSIALLKDVIGVANIAYPLLLLFAFLSWAISLVLVLYSFSTASKAFLRAAARYVEGPDTFDPDRDGGSAGTWTVKLNFFSGLFCVGGLILVAAFMFANIGGKKHEGGQKVKVSGEATVIAPKAEQEKESNDQAASAQAHKGKTRSEKSDSEDKEEFQKGIGERGTVSS